MIIVIIVITQYNVDFGLYINVENSDIEENEEFFRVFSFKFDFVHYFPFFLELSIGICVIENLRDLRNSMIEEYFIVWDLDLNIFS